MFGIACIDEALILRKIGIQTPIILLEGVFEANELMLASIEEFHVVFHSDHQIEWLNTQSLPKPINAWLKVDTGMGRLGFGIEQAFNVYEKLTKCSLVAKPVRIMSHLACADDKQHPLNYKQIHSFQEFVASLSRMYAIEYSLCNSAGIINFPECNYDFVKPGLSLYGASPISTYTNIDLNLKPVMTLQTNIIAIKSVAKGSSIGYGARYICFKDMKIAIIAFGYGDGYPANTTDGTPVLINETKCKIVGRVSMDMTAIDITDCPDAKIGTPVILWGNGLPVEEVAKFSDISCYEILSRVQN